MSDSPVNQLNTLNIDMGHQEIARIVLELEKYAEQFPEGFDIPVEAAEQWLWVQLGYGDSDELEDALKGSVEAFIRRLPQFEVSGSGEKVTFKPSAVTPESSRPRKLTLLIRTTKDLFTVMSRGRDTRLEIPELEFEMAAPETREVDTVYNYIGGAVFQLGQYIRDHSPSDEVFDNIYATMQTLNAMLDVEVPFHLIAHDPCGQVAFRAPEKGNLQEHLAIEFTD